MVGLATLLEQMDTESADCLATELSIQICGLMGDFRPLMACPLVVAYLEDLSELCRRCIMPHAPNQDHREVITDILSGLIWRIKLRMWFLYVDTMLYG